MKPQSKLYLERVNAALEGVAPGRRWVVYESSISEDPDTRYMTIYLRIKGWDKGNSRIRSIRYAIPYINFIRMGKEELEQFFIDKAVGEITGPERQLQRWLRN